MRKFLKGITLLLCIVMVLGLVPTAIFAADGAEPSEIPDLGALEIPGAAEIRGNITLVEAFNGAEITWTSSNPEVVTDQAAGGKAAGVVTRGAVDQKVILTATSGAATKEIEVTVKAAPTPVTEDDYVGYLFGHFIGEGGANQEQIYFAISEDGRNFTDMNSGQPVITSSVGELGLRDPYMYRSPEGDRFFIVATDLSIYHRGGWKKNEQGYYDPSTTGSHYLVVYESTDLVNWGAPKHIKVAPENAGMAWAPEMIYHEESGQYIIFFASSIMNPETKYKAKPNAIYYVATRDFVNFSETRLLIDNQTDGVAEGGTPREIIDTTIIKIGDWYYSASKDGDNAEANGGIRVMKTQNLLDYTSWEKVYDLDELNLDLTGLTGLRNGRIDNSTLEGPEFFRFNKKDWADPNVPEYGLFADQYASGSGYLPIITTNIEDVDNSENSWKILRPGEYSFDTLKKRHGTIVNLTQAELDRVKEAYANSEEYLGDKEVKRIANLLTIPNSTAVRGNITLMDELEGATITWTSSNKAVVTDAEEDGKAAGVVTRGARDTRVTLTATLTKNGYSTTKNIRVTVKAAPAAITEDDYVGYLFGHFIGEGGANQEQIYFAISEDGRNFTDMNSGQPVITSTVGELGLRDPYMYRSPEGDRFFIVATDLSIYHRGGWRKNEQGYYDPSTTGSHYLVVYESTDLVNWSAPKHIKVAPENAGMAWAPEMIYHEESGQYIIFFASSIMNPETKYKAKPNAIYYVATRDFVNFSETRLLIDNQTDGVAEGGTPREIIDTTIIKIGDWYYSASKDGDNAEANGGIRVMKTQNLLDYTSWEKVYDLDELNLDLTGLTGLRNGRIDNSTLEGPEFFRFNKKDWADPNVPEYGLFADQYASGSGYLPIITTNIEDVDNSENSWKILRPGEYSFDTLKKRHGTVVNLTQAELDRVKEAYANSEEYLGDKEVKRIANLLTIPNSTAVRGNITLIDELEGATITWTSSNKAVVTDAEADGKAAGVVTRGERDTRVTLTATLTKNGYSTTKNIRVTVKAAPAAITEDDYVGYLFGHFIGEGSANQEQIYFAISEDGRNFTDMNSGQPVITSTVGELGLRDPYMYRSPEGDRFFIVATDLSIYHRGGWKKNEQGYYDPSTTGSHYLVVYESTDLVNWGAPKHIKVAPENAGMAWAPEMIYHEESGQYIIFFASSIMNPETKYKAKPNAIYYVATRDFVNFSETKLLIDNQTDGVAEGGTPREIIDTTVIKIGDWYYSASKDGDNAEANGGIRVMKTQNLLDYTSWEKVYDLDELNLDLTGLTGLRNGRIDNSTLEGPEFFRFNKKDWADPNVPEYGLFADQYASGAGYLPIITTNVEDVDNSEGSWKILRPGEYSFDTLRKRHGTIVNLTQAELDRVKEAYANSEEYLGDKEVKRIANLLTIPNSTAVRGNITLIDELEGATITWTSSNKAVVTDAEADGKAAGVVTRGARDTRVTLTATLTKNGYSTTKNIRVTVKAAPAAITEDDYVGYLFGHFIGEGAANQEQIYFAISEDGRNFTDMNSGQPVITSTVGELGLRDPYMYRSPEGDRFFIVATDLSIFNRGGWKKNEQGYYDPSTTGSHYLVVYESTDLVNWGAPKHIKVAPENAGMAWAPEMIYHEESGQYIIFFASSIMNPETKYKAKPNAIYYVATRDFVNFSETKLLIDNQTDGVAEGGTPREIIDTTIIKIGDWYYSASKDGDNAEANGGIRVMKTQNLLDYTSWEKVYDLDELNLDLTGLTGLRNGRIDNSTLEGPEFFRFNKKDWADPDVPEYGLFADQYASGSGYLPIITTNVEDVDNSENSWKILRPGEYSFDTLRKRHGTIVNLTQAELDRVKEAYANSPQYLADKEATKIADTLSIANTWNITEDIDLVTEKDGAVITWTSNNPAVVAPDGKVTRGERDQWVNLTATVVLGEGTATRSFRVRVLKAEPQACEHAYEAVVTAPTCTEAGYTTYTCSKCGESYVADEVAALGHDYRNGVCTRCGAADPDYKPPVDEQVLEELYRLAREAIARAQVAQQAAEDALAAAEAAGGANLEALEAARTAAQAAQTAAEQAMIQAAAAEAAARVSDRSAAIEAAQAAQSAAYAAEQAAKTAQAQAAAQAAQAAAEAAQAAAEAAKAAAANDQAAVEAAKAAAEAAKQAAETAKAAAQAADADAAAQAAQAAAKAAEAARAQAEAAFAQAAAEAAEAAARAAQAKAEAAQANAGADQAAAAAAKQAAESAKQAAENARAAAEAAKNAAGGSNTAAAAAAAQAAQSAAQVAEALKTVAGAQAEIAAAKAAAEAAAMQAAAAKAAAEAARAAAEAAELNAVRYQAAAKLANAVAATPVPAEKKSALAAAAEAGFDAIEAAADKAAIMKALEEGLYAVSKVAVDTCPSRMFADAPAQDNWAHAGIDYCVANGLMKGVSETVFDPAGDVTRAQLVTILYRLAGEPAAEYKGTFSDVADGLWYTKAIEWASANEVVNGVGNGKFAPDTAITREQIAAILYRCSGSPKAEGSLAAFPDYAAVSEYAVDAMVWATGTGLINGIGQGDKTILSPQTKASRAQIASIIMRCAES